MYYNTSKQNDPARWIEARVLSTGDHMFKCKRTQKGPPMTVAYDHVRLAPESELARELMLESLEDMLSQNNETCLTVQSWDNNGTCQIDKLMGVDDENDPIEEPLAIGRLPQPDLSVNSSVS